VRAPRPVLAVLVGLGLLAAAGRAGAHPLGNFSVSQYAGLRIGPTPWRSAT
jgi:hypothetical protein